MSEVTEQPTEVEAPEAEAEETGAEFDKERALAKIAKTNSEAKNLRDENKALRAAAAELAAIKESQKTEAEKAADRTAQLDKDLAEARRQLAIEKIARKHDIAEEDMDLLGSGTEEEIEARAVRLAAKNAAAAGGAGAPPTNRTTERLRPGASPTERAAVKSVSAGRNLYAATHGKS